MYYFFRLTEMSETVFTCILDDFNCDMLDPDKPPKEGRDFVDIIDIFAFENLICEVTRITNNWQTLLDLASTNRKSRVLQAGISNLHISDHALIYAILHASSWKCRSQKICFCSVKNYDLDKFCADLNCALFVMVMNSCEDVDSNLQVDPGCELMGTVTNEMEKLKANIFRGCTEIHQDQAIMERFLRTLAECLF